MKGVQAATRPVARKAHGDAAAALTTAGGNTFDERIGHTYSRPATPRLNGKVERSHRIDAEEFYRMLDGVLIDDAEVFNGKLRE